MISVSKEKNSVMNDVINVQTDEGNFYISFEGDLNLYFSYLGNTLDDKDEYSFTIDKSNSFLYECFDDLYESVMNEMPFRNSDTLLNTDEVFPLNHGGELVHDDGIIDWHSDDEDNYDLSSALLIEPDMDFYRITFKKSKEKTGHNAYSVCIKNGGSLYDPYNAAFMIMYNRLRNHDFELDNVKTNDVVKVRKR